MNCETVPVFTLKKPKPKNLEVNNQTVLKSNNSISTFALYSGSNGNPNVKDQRINSLKKHKCANNLASTKPPFYSSFFQYLAYIKQNSTNIFAPCPEWPLLIHFFSKIASISKTSCFKKKRYPTVVKGKAEITVKEQRKHIYSKVKRKSQKRPRDFISKVAASEKRSRHWALRELCSKPLVNYQIIKRFILLNYLGQSSPSNSALYQKLKFKKNRGLVPQVPKVGTFLALAKEVGNKEKRLYINSVPINKEEMSKVLHTHKISYAFCPRSNVNILNLKNIKKLTKQIENFRSDIKLLAPLGLLLHRSFSEPVGINCISAVDNRLEKTYCNQSLKNLLFRRTPDNFLKSSYMNSQTGLLRAKNTILFDFAYTKDSLIKLGLKKTNTLMQQLLETGHTKLWLRKLSSIRL